MNTFDDVIIELDERYIEPLTDEVVVPPTHDRIARRAYEIFLDEGVPDPFRNWIRAERELTAARA